MGSATVNRQRADRKARFLKAYVAAGTIRGAAKAAGISRECHFGWVRVGDPNYDADYARAFADAQDELTERLEQEAIRRATTGRSDTMLIFLLKARRPDVYRDRVEHTGKDGAPLYPDAIIIRREVGVRSEGGST